MSGGFLQNIKGRLTETVKSIAGPNDPYERRLYDLVERATNELLTGPDWAVNIELVDSINTDPRGATDKVLRALRRAFMKPSINAQLLALTVLESCVKNCVPFFFQSLINSELWHEIMRVGDPGRRWDAEVRDRALVLIEDFGRGLPMEAFKDAYEGLLDRGVDFPARPPAEDHGIPYYTPPPPPAAGVGPDEGLSPEDAAAINAALAQNEAEERQQREREASLAPPGLPPGGHVPAAMGPAVLLGAPIRPPGYRPPPGYHPPHPAVPPAMVATPGVGPLTAGLTGGAAAAAGAAHQIAVSQGMAGTAGVASAAGAPGGAAGIPLPASNEEAGQAVRVALNSAELLAEMLAPIQAAGEGADPGAIQEVFITDLADQCYRYRSVLAELIPGTGSDELVSSALAANDELQRALTSYEALSLKLLGTTGSSSTDVPPANASTGGAVAAAGGGEAVAAGGVEASSGGAVPTFTLLGDEEAEEETTQLQTNRRGTAGGAGGDLISFTDTTGGSAAASGAGSSTKTGQAGAAASELEQLKLE